MSADCRNFIVAKALDESTPPRTPLPSLPINESSAQNAPATPSNVHSSTPSFVFTHGTSAETTPAQPVRAQTPNNVAQKDADTPNSSSKSKSSSKDNDTSVSQWSSLTPSFGLKISSGILANVYRAIEGPEEDRASSEELLTLLKYVKDLSHTTLHYEDRVLLFNAVSRHIKAAPTETPLLLADILDVVHTLVIADDSVKPEATDPLRSYPSDISDYRARKDVLEALNDAEQDTDAEVLSRLLFHHMGLHLSSAPLFESVPRYVEQVLKSFANDASITPVLKSMVCIVIDEASGMDSKALGGVLKGLKGFEIRVDWKEIMDKKARRRIFGVVAACMDRERERVDVGDAFVLLEAFDLPKFSSKRAAVVEENRRNVERLMRGYACVAVRAVEERKFEKMIQFARFLVNLFGLVGKEGKGLDIDVGRRGSAAGIGGESEGKSVADMVGKFVNAALGVVARGDEGVGYKIVIEMLEVIGLVQKLCPVGEIDGGDEEEEVPLVRGPRRERNGTVGTGERTSDAHATDARSYSTSASNAGTVNGQSSSRGRSTTFVPHSFPVTVKQEESGEIGTGAAENRSTLASILQSQEAFKVSGKKRKLDAGVKREEEEEENEDDEEDEDEGDGEGEDDMEVDDEDDYEEEEEEDGLERAFDLRPRA
ncbi:hypothetical protein HDV00_008573 [Rhizophlyctis rosea]|nr:hypothetical protein HDV00_008573 [Rhizophlyctis rosea]